MKSNKCLFSKTVFKSNVLRFLPFAAPLLIAELIAFPLALFNSERNFDLNTFSSVSLASDIISMLFAGLFVLLVFSYLFKANSCNAFHAFPVGRKALFTTGVISSYVLLVVPQLIAFAAGIPVIMRSGALPSQYIALGLTSIFGVSLIAVATAVLAVMLAGNFFAAVVLYGIINFLYVAADTVLSAAVRDFGVGLDYTVVLTHDLHLSPLASLVSTKAGLGRGLGYEHNTQLKDYYKLLIIFAVAAIVILAVSWLLYKIRRLETAGDMVSFKVEIPVLSVIASVFGGAFFTALLDAIFSFGNITTIITYIIFTLLCYFGAQMIIRRTAKVFGAKGFLIWALAACITLGATLGLAIHETYLVPAKNIKSVVVNTSYEFEPEREDYVTVAQLHRALIDNEAKGRSPLRLIIGDIGVEEKPEEAVYDTKTDSVGSYAVNLTYTLTNGRQIARCYSVDYESNKEIDTLVNKLEEKNDPQTVFDRLEGIDITIKSCIVEDYASPEDDEIPSVTLNAKEAAELFELCKADENYLKKNYKTTKETSSEMVNSSYNVSFTFKVNDEKALETLSREGYFNDFNYSSVEYFSNEFDENGEKDYFLLTVSNFLFEGKAEQYIKDKMNK